MSILSWNCRGLGNPSAIPTLRDLVRTYQPDVMFLCETLVHANKIVEIRIKLGFDEAFAVDRIGRSGELAIMWKNKVKCKIINYSQNFINAEISSDSWSSWRFTGFYGYPEHDRRRDSWDLLRSLSQDTSLPWCVMGDFNDMLSAEDKRGGTTQPNWLIRGFREAVQDSRLVDLPMEGYQFTWTKGRRVQNPTEERLDRALATQSWLDKFPQFKFINAIADRSDHSPILLRLIHQTKEFKARIFKFENAWLDEQDLNGVVQDAWMKDTHDPLLSKLKRCTEDLESWSSKLRSRFTKSIAELREEMERNQDTTRPISEKLKVSYVRRQANRAAHDLAQATRFFASPQVFNYCSPCIENIIMNEMH
ncbi:hypothetical protein P8452_77796 [Trifolium repens]|nr:hypothetical protein P8452_77796 [Trifolium repens]